MKMEQSNRPLVSVCIPCYKYPDILKRCLNSILIQTYKNIEIIITDDSRDNVIEALIAKEFDDKRIYYFHNEYQKGSPENWNSALQKAKGDYIKIMHHDDWFSREDALQIFVESIVEQKGDFAFCDCTNVLPNKSKPHKMPKAFFKKWIKNKELILLTNYVGDPSVTIFRNTFANSTLFDTRTKWLVDALFYFEYLKVNPQVVYINQNLINITAGASSQITNSEINNSIIIKEYEYIYNKVMIHIEKKSIHRICLLEIVQKFKCRNFFDEKLIKFYGLNDVVSLPYQIFTLIKKLYFNYG